MKRVKKWVTDNELYDAVSQPVNNGGTKIQGVPAVEKSISDLFPSNS